MNSFFLRYSLYILFLLLINFFFYSLISIALYKIICNETNYFTLLDYSNTFDKRLNIYFSNEVNTSFVLLDIKSYTLLFYCILDLYNIFFFYFTLTDFYVESYSFSSLAYLENEYLIRKYSNLDIVHLTFFIRSSNLNIVNALSLQKMLLINLNETSLFFFRLYNPTHFKLELITLYVVFPNEMSLYVNKIQCFCFNVMFLYPLEIIDLPVLIYIISYIPYLFIFNIDIISHLIIYYIIFLHS